MSGIVYFDTSALAKWYLKEARSEDVEKYLQKQGPVAISDLTLVEMRCLLARRRRERSITATMEMEVFAVFQEDIRQRHLVCHPLPSGLTAGAVNLLALLSEVPVRTLDILHLTIAKEISADTLATADRVMAAGAMALGLSVKRF
jgi:predicted nucleic acid-binding protein